MFSLLAVIGACVILFVFYKACKFKKYSNYVKDMPRIKYKSVFCNIMGNICDFSSQPEIFFKEVRKVLSEMEGTFITWTPLTACVNLMEPEDIERVLSSSKVLEKGFFYKYLHSWLKEGLLTSGGAKWQHRRKVLTRAFHFNILKRYFVTMGKNGEKLVQVLREECSNEKTNIISILSKSSLEIISETAMGTKIDAFNEKQAKYIEAVYGMSPIIVKRIVSPWLFYDGFFYLLSFIDALRQKKYVKTLHDFTKHVIVEREEKFRPEDVEESENAYDECVSKKKSLAMLDLLISAKRNSNSIDDEGIQEEVDTFMFEGHDTTANAMCFAFLLLANHKEVQDKVYEEIIDMLNPSDIPTIDELQNMRYLDMVIKECLRLYPSVPFISRVTTEEIKLKKHTIPAGCEIFIHIYDLHRNPDVYPDPERFDPERFSDENCRERHPYAYVPFSAGPRNCIGQKFAQLELKSIIATTLKHFVLEPVTRVEDVELKTDIVIRTTGPIYVKFRLRNKDS